jgi:hypothetical protein
VVRGSVGAGQLTRTVIIPLRLSWMTRIVVPVPASMTLRPGLAAS